MTDDAKATNGKLQRAKPHSFYEIFGWYGTCTIVGAYVLVTLYPGLNKQEILVYQILNLTGSFGIASISFLKKVWQPFALNVLWASIAVFGLLHALI